MVVQSLQLSEIFWGITGNLAHLNMNFTVAQNLIYVILNSPCGKLAIQLCP